MSKKTESDVLEAPQSEAIVSVTPFPEQTAKKPATKKSLVYDESGQRTVSKSEVRSMTGIVNRQDAFTLDPRIIVVDEDTNPRKDYGSDEEWQEHVDSIRSMGVREAIQVYVREDKAGKRVFHLAQGFRRMRAAMQIIAENPDAIQTVPVTITDGNRERMLLDHLVLNGSKELSEIEKAGIIAQLSAWSYEVKDIAEMTKYTEAKVRRYIDLINGASKQVIKAIQNKTMSISTGIELVKSTPDTVEQNKKLSKAVEVAQAKVEAAAPKPTPKSAAAPIADLAHDADEHDVDLEVTKLKVSTPAATTPAAPAPLPPLRVKAADFEDSAVAKKTTNSLEFKVSSLMNIVDKESMQFPDDIDMVFVDRVKELFKMLNKGASNHEIMVACFSTVS
jgi:ParB/RepB/Spo0J family partition protein